jgi:transposase
MTEEAPQRDQSMREAGNSLRCTVRAGTSWRLMPHDLPPWYTVSQQSRRWRKAGVFEDVVHDLCAILRVAHGRTAQPSAVMFDRRTIPSTPESGTRAGDDRATNRRGSTRHQAVDTPGHLLGVPVTAANEPDRHQVHALTAQVQEATGDAGKVVSVD